MVMYCLLTLEEPRSLDGVLEMRLQRENFLPGDHIMPPIRTQKPQSGEYSEELCTLIRNCLQLRPVARPDLKSLLNDASHGVLAYETRLKDRFRDDPQGLSAATMLYHEGNEINGLTPGPYKFDLDQDWWDRFDHVEKWTDPDLPRLYPPGHPTIKRPSGFRLDYSTSDG